MMKDANNNNFVELLLIVNSTLQFHLTFPNIVEFRMLHHDIQDMLLRLAIRVEQIFDDVSQLMNENFRHVSLQIFLKMWLSIILK